LVAKLDAVKSEGATMSVHPGREWKDLELKWSKSAAGGNFSVTTPIGSIEEILPVLAKGDWLSFNAPLPDGTEVTKTVPLKGSRAAIKTYTECLEDVQPL
jgi:hypothetical protein